MSYLSEAFFIPGYHHGRAPHDEEQISISQKSDWVRADRSEDIVTYEVTSRLGI